MRAWQAGGQAGVLLFIAAVLGSTLASVPLAEATPNPVDWANCQTCHATMYSGLPPLSTFRPPPGSHQLETDCRSCHSPTELDSLNGDWQHPVRPVADHLACTDCHVSAPHDAEHPLPLPRGDYKPQACYACHKQVEIERHWPSRHHTGIACRDCHPAHTSTQAALPAALVNGPARRTAFRTYDWQLSNALCLKCHSPASLTLRLDGGFAVLNTVNYHELHVVRGQSLCVECHSAHGSTRPALLRSQLLDGDPLSFMPRPDGGSCTTTCHGVEHRDWQYRSALP